MAPYRTAEVVPREGRKMPSETCQPGPPERPTQPTEVEGEEVEAEEVEAEEGVEEVERKEEEQVVVVVVRQHQLERNPT